MQSWKKESPGNENEPTSQTPATSGPTGATTPPSATGNASGSRSAGGSSFLDEILKTGKAAPGANDKPTDAHDYKAFHIEKRPETLELRLSPDDGEIFDYMLVKTISFRLGKQPERITVYTSVGRILLKGRNLRELKEGFTRRGVAYVQEYDALHFAALPDDAPCIEQIDFVPLEGSKPVREKATASASALAADPV